MNLLQREQSKILAGTVVGYGKSGLRHKKSSNISQTLQDRTKITIEDQ